MELVNKAYRKWKLYNDGQFFDVKSDPEEQQPLDTSGLLPEAQEALQFLLDARQSLIAGIG